MRRCVAVIVLSLVSALAAAGTPASGSVSGRLVAPGAPSLQDAHVLLARRDGGDGGETYADAAGNYRIEHVAVGDYVLVVTPPDGFLTTAWPNVRCGSDCNFAALPTFAVADAAVTGIDVYVLAAARIDGRVIDAATQQPLAAARIGLQQVESGLISENLAETDGDGRYEIPTLEPGQYIVFARGPDDYVAEAHDGSLCTYFCLVPPVTLALPGDAATLDFALERGGRFGGTVDWVPGGSPSGGSVVVLALDGEGRIVLQTRVTRGSAYTSSGLPPGDYFVRTRTSNGQNVDELFEDQACFWCRPPTGRAVTIVVGAVAPAVDFALAPGTALGGTLREAGRPEPRERARIEYYDTQGRLIERTGFSGTGGAWRTGAGLAPGTYYLVARSAGLYYDELLGGVHCAPGCDVRAGTPVVVGDSGTTPVTDLDFELDPVPEIFRDGFETDGA